MVVVIAKQKKQFFVNQDRPIKYDSRFKLIGVSLQEYISQFLKQRVIVLRYLVWVEIVI